MPIDTSAVPVALIQGLNDGRALPARATATYPELEAPKALIEIEGANHYGINDVNNPSGATPNPSPSLISQAEALDRIATWSALFLRAENLGRPDCALLRVRVRRQHRRHGHGDQRTLSVASWGQNSMVENQVDPQPRRQDGEARWTFSGHAGNRRCRSCAAIAGHW